MEGEEVLWRRMLPSGLLLFVLYLAGKALALLWLRPRSLEKHFAKQGIRGPPYRFFHGNVRELIGLMVEASSKPLVPKWSHDILPRVLAFYPRWKEIYGSIFLLWFGPTPRIVVSEPELIREILVSRSECYEKYDAHPAIRQLEGRGLLNLKGDKWACHRKLLSPAFHMENLKLSAPLIGRTAVEAVDKWIATSAASGEMETEVSEWYQSLTLDAINKMAFGSSYEDGKAILQLQSKQMSHAVEAFQCIFIPGYRFLPTPKNMDSWKLNKEVNKMLARLVDSRKKAGTEGRQWGASTPRDLLSFLLVSEDDAEGGEGGVKGRVRHAITVDDMVEECKTFYFAGTHTTSYMLTWSTLMLAMHPEWQDRVRAEVLHVCGSRDPPTREHVGKLKALGMIVNETLRLYPPVVAMIRRAKADVELGGRYVVPAGTEIMLPIMAIHHDPQLWGPDCAEFRPTRFADGVARAARHPTAFIPFGLGPRACLGQNLALLEAKITLAAILQRFSIGVSPSYVHAPTVLMLLYPQRGAPVVLRRLPGS